MPGGGAARQQCARVYDTAPVFSSYLDGSLAALSAKLDEADEELPGILSSERPVLRFPRRRARQAEEKQQPRSLAEALSQSVVAPAA